VLRSRQGETGNTYPVTVVIPATLGDFPPFLSALNRNQLYRQVYEAAKNAVELQWQSHFWTI